MRRLVVLLLVLAGLLLGLDRVAVVAAQRDVAERIEAEEHLDAAPHVTIGGFPFLTQLLSGTYDDVTVRMSDVHAGGLTIATVAATFKGVHASFGEVVRQQVTRLPTDRVEAQLLLRYPDVARLLPGAGAVLAVDVPVRLSDGRLVFTVAGVSAAVQLPRLPFGLRAISVKSTPSGLLVRASATDVVLRP